jgi:hypothetical protein
MNLYQKKRRLVANHFETEIVMVYSSLGTGRDSNRGIDPKVVFFVDPKTLTAIFGKSTQRLPGESPAKTKIYCYSFGSSVQIKCV